MGFGRLLALKLEVKNIKQSDLADNIGINRTTLNSIITRDTSKVEIETFLKICRYIGCDPEEFYDEYVVSNTQSSSTSLTARQKEILSLFEELTDIQQDIIIDRAKMFAEENERIAIQKETGS